MDTRLRCCWYIAQPGDRCRNNACRFVATEEEGGWVAFEEQGRGYAGTIDGYGGYLKEGGVLIVSGWCPRCVARHEDMLRIEPKLIEGTGPPLELDE